MSARADRIFLSHRGADKDLVRDYKQTLEVLGLRPWLDEDDLPAGTELERALQAGMKASCAAVFFVTPSFADEKYLRAEINYAVAEKRQRAEAFAIITLLLRDGGGNAGRVPELLEPYVWKEPASSLQGLREILRALPSPLQDIGPRANLASAPDVRVQVKRGHLASTGEPTKDVVSVRIENHDNIPIFLTGGASADRTDEDGFLWFRHDALGQPSYPLKLEPGAAHQTLLLEGDLKKVAANIRTFFFSDQIGRHFHADPLQTREVLDAIADQAR